MPLLDRTVHVARPTADVDRLVGFYATVFDADVLFDTEERGRRRVGLRLDRATVLQPYEVADHRAPAAPVNAMPGDALALDTGSPDAFLEVRERLVAAGASDGVIRDFGPVYSVGFVDPDGVELLINLTKRHGDGSDWRTVDETELRAGGSG